MTVTSMNNYVNISLPSEIVIGKDILELVSSSMYVDPLTVYREYVQNSADSIDDARRTGILTEDEPGRIDITLDLKNRGVKVRDNGAGVSNEEFASRLLALGGSRKRGSSARGFRGVGRLAGLGYCQEVVFRSRSVVDTKVLEVRWDCKKFKKLLIDHAYHGSLQDLILEVVTVSEVPGDDWPSHFYEVELIKPIRIKSDLLLNRDAISLYLAQVAPVPFSPDFRFGAEIKTRLVEHLGSLGEVNIHIDGSEAPIYRPYRNDYGYGDTKRDQFTDLEFRVVEGFNGGTGAVVWLLHHGYHGAIPLGEGVNGLRARRGNIQIGDHRIFSEAFPESRFASWTVGEVHVLDERVVPNGRRDDFEQNAPYGHLVTRLIEVGDHIGRLCRNSSVVRNRIKAFDLGALKVEEQLTILEQGAIGEAAAKSIVENIRSEMFEIQKVAASSILRDDDKVALSERYAEMEKRLSETDRVDQDADAFAQFPESERAVIQRMIELIYDCSTNRVAAKSLVDRILARMGEH